MTTNQIAYQRLLEESRANQAQEAELRRSNLARETETNRSNVAKETETHRSHKANEAIGSMSSQAQMMAAKMKVVDTANSTVHGWLRYVIPSADTVVSSGAKVFASLI